VHCGHWVSRRIDTPANLLSTRGGGLSNKSDPKRTLHSISICSAGTNGRTRRHCHRSPSNSNPRLYVDNVLWCGISNLFRGFGMLHSAQRSCQTVTCSIPTCLSTQICFKHPSLFCGIFAVMVTQRRGEICVEFRSRQRALRNSRCNHREGLV